jgi:hypothetical protein
VTTVSAPTGYQIGLPPGWEAIDPGRRAGRRPPDLAPVEQSLVDVVNAADGPGVRFAALVQGDADGLRFQAALTIGVYRIGTANDAGSLSEALAGFGSPGGVVVVDLPVGKVVRRAPASPAPPPGEKAAILVQFYVPVPATSDQVAVLTFSSPTPEPAGSLTGEFDAMAETFGFTFGGRTPLGLAGSMGAHKPVQGKVW